MRRKSSLSKYLLGWKFLPNPGNTAENIGVLFPITNPQFLHKTLAFGELFDAEFPKWESPPGEPINILWGIIPAKPGVVEFPGKWSRSCLSPTWGPWAVSLSFIRAGHGLAGCAHQIWPNLKVTLVFGKAKPCWALKSPETITSSAVLAENVGSSLKLTVSGWLKSRFYFWGALLCWAASSGTSVLFSSEVTMQITCVYSKSGISAFLKVTHTCFKMLLRVFYCPVRGLNNNCSLPAVPALWLSNIFI